MPKNGSKSVASECKFWYPQEKGNAKNGSKSVAWVIFLIITGKGWC